MLSSTLMFKLYLTLVVVYTFFILVYIFYLTESQCDYILVSITVIRCLSLIFSLCCLNEIFAKLG